MMENKDICHFYKTHTKDLTNKSKPIIKYPDLSSATRLILRCAQSIQHYKKLWNLFLILMKDKNFS